MKKLKMLIPLISLPTIVAPIATVISCGASQKPEEWHKQLFTPREVKVEVPDELFPGVKQDPIKFDEIKNKLLSFTESYDQDGNYILENDDVIFKFDKDAFGADKIPDIDLAKEIFKASMQQINSITTDFFLNNNNSFNTKKIVEFVNRIPQSSALGLTGGLKARISVSLVRSNGYYINDLDILKLALADITTHEFVHMQENDLLLNLQKYDEYYWINRFKGEINGFANNEMQKWTAGLLDDNSVRNSLSHLMQSRLDNAATLARDVNTIRPLDFMGEKGSDSFWEPSSQSFEGSLVGADETSKHLEMEFFAYLNSTFTQNILKNKFSDNQQKEIIKTLTSVPQTFGLNFFNITKPRQAYDVMKPFVEEIYNVSKKPLVQFAGSQLFINGVGFPQLDTLDHYKVFFNGKEVISHKFVKKDVAIGFNRNPFTPNEYKYVTKSISNSFTDAAIGNQLGLTSDNTELKFYDINDNEITLDYDKM